MFRFGGESGFGFRVSGFWCLIEVKCLLKLTKTTCNIMIVFRFNVQELRLVLLSEFVGELCAAVV